MRAALDIQSGGARAGAGGSGSVLVVQLDKVQVQPAGGRKVHRSTEDIQPPEFRRAAHRTGERRGRVLLGCEDVDLIRAAIEVVDHVRGDRVAGPGVDAEGAVVDRECGRGAGDRGVTAGAELKDDSAGTARVAHRRAEGGGTGDVDGVHRRGRPGIQDSELERALVDRGRSRVAHVARDVVGRSAGLREAGGGRLREGTGEVMRVARALEGDRAARRDRGIDGVILAEALHDVAVHHHRARDVAVHGLIEGRRAPRIVGDGARALDDGGGFNGKRALIRRHVAVGHVHADDAELVDARLGERKAGEIEQLSATGVGADVEALGAADGGIAGEGDEAGRVLLPGAAVVDEGAISADARARDVDDFVGISGSAKNLIVDVQRGPAGDECLANEAAERRGIPRHHGARRDIHRAGEGVGGVDRQRGTAGLRDPRRPADDARAREGDVVRTGGGVENARRCERGGRSQRDDAGGRIRKGDGIEVEVLLRARVEVGGGVQIPVAGAAGPRQGLGCDGVLELEGGANRSHGEDAARRGGHARKAGN